MKMPLLIGTAIFLTLTSCESYKYPEKEIFLTTSNGFEYRYDDFELYDSSTHILYFKTNHPEFKTESTATFTFFVNGEEIYNGIFLPVYSSYLPSGPFIYSSPSFYEKYILRIEFWINNDNQDLRNDPRIIDALKEHNLLHSGLSITINSININETQLTFKFTVTNQDKTDLLIFDLDRTGPELFHNFTNGLYIRDLNNNEVFPKIIEPRVPLPIPWNIWEPTWIS